MNEFKILHTMLTRIIEKEANNLETLDKELKSLPKGTLIIRTVKDTAHFAENFNRKEHGITRNLPRVKQLARKAILVESLHMHSKNIETLKCCSDNLQFELPEKCRNRIAGVGLNDAFYSEQELYWINNAQSCNPYNPTHLRYKTSNGILVRSKSERIIADRLEHYGIIYRYEPSFELLDGGKLVYPDFMILRYDGQPVIWEHLGLMNNEEYAYKNMQKLKSYNSMGFKQHSNLICTDEHDVEDIEKIDEIILRFFF